MKTPARLALLLAALAASSLTAQEAPLVGGPEFEVGEGGQFPTSALAADDSGRFVVVWQDEDGSSGGIEARRFASDGSPLGGALQVNLGTAGNENRPDVATHPTSGDFVVAWATYTVDLETAVYARRFDSAGQPSTSDVVVADLTSDLLGWPRVDVLPSGDFVVAWEEQGYTTSRSVRARRFDAQGAPLGGQFFLDSYATSNQSKPDVESDASGNLLIVWTDDELDTGILGRRYSSTGMPVGDAFLIDEGFHPRLARTPSGRSVVAFVRQPDFNEPREPWARRLAADGSALGAAFRVTSEVGENQDEPAVTISDAGTFVVAWQADGRDGSGEGIFARAYSSLGLPLGPDFQVNSATAFDQSWPALALSESGVLFTAWGQDATSPPTVQARLFKLPLFADGFESGDTAAWSSAVGAP